MEICPPLTLTVALTPTLSPIIFTTLALTLTLILALNLTLPIAHGNLVKVRHYLLALAITPPASSGHHVGRLSRRL